MSIVRRVLVASFYNREAIAPALERLAEHAEVIMGNDFGRNLTEDELIERLSDCPVVIAADEPYTQRVFQAAPELQLIARDGVGFDRIDLQAATRHSVIANNAPVVHEAAADLTFGLILATVRRIVVADRGVRAGQWADRDAYLSSGVHGKTLGILGLGRVGRAVARRASGFDMNVIAYDVAADPAVAEELGVQLVQWDVLLSSAGIISLHVPLTAQTSNMIDEQAISQMKDGAYLINASRGEVVDQDALLAALRNGKLAGAGLDVLRQEPPAEDDLLLQLENVVLTPHIGSDTVDTFAQVFTTVVADILLLFERRRPRHVLNPEVLRHERFAQLDVS